MSDPEVIRRAVERTYANASAPTLGTRLAGYTDAQLATVPEGTGFYGCGNPLAYADVKPGQTVLDLGSGAGFDLILAGHAVGPTGRVIGIDMTDAMIERGRANVARAGLSSVVEIRKGLIERLPVEDASVDWVISNCVISLSPEKDRVFSEVARVLKPGGRMAISDIVVDDRLAWLLKRLTRIAPSIAMARPEEHYLTTMRAAGLVDVEIADRYIYDANELIGTFGGDATREAAAACPIGAIGDQIKQGPIGRTAVKGAARLAAGHVWSSKFRAARA